MMDSYTVSFSILEKLIGLRSGAENYISLITSKTAIAMRGPAKMLSSNRWTDCDLLGQPNQPIFKIHRQERSWRSRRNGSHLH